MTITLNQIFFFLHQNQNIFFSNIGNQNIFLEKNHKPPLQHKWSFPKYLHLLIYYLSGYFRRGVNFAFFSQTVRVGSNFEKIEKSKIKNFTISALS